MRGPRRGAAVSDRTSPGPRRGVHAVAGSCAPRRGRPGGVETSGDSHRSRLPGRHPRPSRAPRGRGGGRKPTAVPAGAWLSGAGGNGAAESPQRTPPPTHTADPLSHTHTHPCAHTQHAHARAHAATHTRTGHTHAQPTSAQPCSHTQVHTCAFTLTSAHSCMPLAHASHAHAHLYAKINTPHLHTRAHTRVYTHTRPQLIPTHTRIHARVLKHQTYMPVPSHPPLTHAYARTCMLTNTPAPSHLPLTPADAHPRSVPCAHAELREGAGHRAQLAGLSLLPAAPPPGRK